MALYIDVKSIPDWENKCVEKDPSEQHRMTYGHLTAMAATIGHAAMITYVGELKNEDDCYEFFVRLHAWAGMNGHGDTYKDITMDALRDHIGLRTNVFPREARSKWFKRHADNAIRDMKYRERRKKELEEREAKDVQPATAV